MMVARGHSLDDLLNHYPMSTLRDLMKAANANQRESLASSTQGTAVAVLHGLDCGFNKGKQKLLSKFMNTLLGKKNRQREPNKTHNLQDVESQLFSLFSPRK